MLQAGWVIMNVSIMNVPMKRRDLLKLGASVATTPALGIAQEHGHAATGTAKPADAEEPYPGKSTDEEKPPATAPKGKAPPRRERSRNGLVPSAATP